MELYNSFIHKTEELLSSCSSVRVWAYDPELAWPDVGKNQLIMQREAAFELGGNGKSAVAFSCVTTDETLIGADEVWLCGPDLHELRADSAYARIVQIAVQDIGEEDEAFRAIQSIDFAKYHYYPEGYMMRALAEDSREQVRVSSAAVKGGISFRRVGCGYIRQYRKNENVRFVRVIYVTDPAADFKALRELARRSGEVTASLNTIFNGIPTDCASCGLKEICDEVEGMRELHFQQAEKHK